MFKVPTLRNVELTYPYFHDGAAATLEEAVDTMGRLQLGRKFSKDENAKVVAFLKTLTGKQPELNCPFCRPQPRKRRDPNRSASLTNATPSTTHLQAAQAGS